MSGIYLMKNKQDRKKINKTPEYLSSQQEPIDFVMKDNTSIVSPTIRISKAAAGDNWAEINYCHIPKFGRYYFVDNIIAATGGILELECTVDPLMTYAAQLMNTGFFIARSESINSKYFLDTEKALEVKKVLHFTLPLGHIPQDSTGNKFCLTVAGGN